MIFPSSTSAEINKSKVCTHTHTYTHTHTRSVTLAPNVPTRNVIITVHKKKKKIIDDLVGSASLLKSDAQELEAETILWPFLFHLIYHVSHDFHQ